MQYIVSGTKMKEIDKETISEIGIPSMVLMERAALCVCQEVEKIISSSDRVLCLCGIGNNGADGIATARLLFAKGIKVDVLFLGAKEHATEEWKAQFHIIEKMGITIFDGQQDTNLVDKIILSEYNLIIDALCGIGINRPLEGILYHTIKVVNESKTPVVAVDIPSGIHADTAMVMGIGIMAIETVTFGYNKIGLTLYPGASYAGTVKVCDIGFLEETIEKLGADAFTYGESYFLEKYIHSKIPKRKSYGNKGTYGKVLIIAGSKNMCGAAYFSAKAAYRMGVGLVQILSDEVNRIILQTKLPEAILTTYEGTGLEKEHRNAIAWADIIVIGPGLGKNQMAKELLAYVLNQTTLPLIIDADGLNLISEDRKLEKSLSSRCILTPHLGEMARLINGSIDDIKQDLITSAKEYSIKHNVICVLKDARTVVTSKTNQVYINTNGNSGMATGGSGDVLTGVIAGLLAMGLDPFTAASLGVYIHGSAGDKAKEVKGEYGMMASDILDGLELT